MEVIIRPDTETAAELTARLIIDAVQEKPDLVLGLATGRTMEIVYAKLAQAHAESCLNMSQCTTFNLDEYCGLPADNKHSYRAYMNEHLFNKTNIDIHNTHLPNGMATDMKAEAAHYEKLIEEAGGIDFQLLGIGRSGHIGFNEPLSSLSSRTREKALTQATIDQNSPLFDSPEEMPRRAFTMGIGTILDAKRIVTLVTGSEKADVLHKSVEGPITAMVAATALQMHPSTAIIVDEDAAAKLEHKDYFYWIYENEPEWEPYR